MKTKILKFEVSDVQLDTAANEGVFKGYASAWTRDSDEEVLDKGAFKRTLGITGGKVPILWQHQKFDPCGFNVVGEETDRGLSVEGRLALGMSRGRDAYEWLKLCQEVGGRAGLSIGFRVTPNGSYIKDGIRHFKQVELLEYSIVTFPANQDAYVTDVKDGGKGESIASRVFAKQKAAQKDFNEALTEARDMSVLYQERWDLESALYDATQEALGNEKLSSDEKKAEVAKSYEQYAAAMGDWYSRFIDADTDNDPEEDNMDGKNKKAGRAISAATAEQIKQAMGHLADAGAMHQKALGILTNLSKQAYTANDVNQPNPVGGGKAEKAESDPESHSLEALLEMVRSVADRTKAA